MTVFSVVTGAAALGACLRKTPPFSVLDNPETSLVVHFLSAEFADTFDEICFSCGSWFHHCCGFCVVVSLTVGIEFAGIRLGFLFGSLHRS